jgi:radical SAM enzyme (TIGR01210 family)
MPDRASFPVSAPARDRFVVERRGPRRQHDPWRYQGLIVEDERTADGRRAPMATVLLTGRECPWRCAMCDLWQYTTAEDTPRGAIPAQVRAARSALREDGTPVTGMKLYNAGSFFDPRAVPVSDYDDVASALAGLSQVIVESHPALIGPRLDRWLDSLARQGEAARVPALEVAMGLETVHPAALDRINKRLTFDRFARAAAALADRGVALRVFLLISPPFVGESEQDTWLVRSVDAAFSCGASVVSLVPTRAGNGALESLAADGLFREPDLDTIERAFQLALTHAAGHGRLFVDLWDLERFARCPRCFERRRDRLRAMNIEQRVLPRAGCEAAACGVHR